MFFSGLVAACLSLRPHLEQTARRQPVLPLLRKHQEKAPIKGGGGQSKHKERQWW